MLAGTTLAGADRDMTRDVQVGGADHLPRRRLSGCRVDDVGVDCSQDVEAAPGELAGH
jgi:hypothetical protein